MCVSWRCVALRFSELCRAKPAPLLLGNQRTQRIHTKLRVSTRAAHPTQYPHRRPMTLVICLLMAPRGDGRRASKQAKKSNCVPGRTILTRRLQRSIGGTTGMICSCKHFGAWLLICMFSHPTYSLCCRRGRDRLRRKTALACHIVCRPAQRTTTSATPTKSATTSPSRTLTRGRRRRSRSTRGMAQGDQNGTDRRHWQMYVTLHMNMHAILQPTPLTPSILCLNNLKIPSPSPPLSSPGTPIYFPQPRDDAECGMHLHTPLHHSTITQKDVSYCSHRSFSSLSSLVYSNNGA